MDAWIENNLLEKLNYSLYFFFHVISVLCASFSCVIASDTSCKIPFSRFLSHFHYCNVLSLWCIMVRSLLTLSFLSWMERVTWPPFISPVEPLCLHTWAPLSLELLPKWTQNWSALYRVSQMLCVIEVVLKWNETYFHIVCWFLLMFWADRPKMSSVLTGLHVSESSTMLLYKNSACGETNMKSSLWILNNAPEITLPSCNQCSFY